MAGNLKDVMQHTRNSMAAQLDSPSLLVDGKPLAKSQDTVNFAKTTIYLRKETRKLTAIKILDDSQDRDLSEIVNDLLDGWTSGRLTI